MKIKTTGLIGIGRFGAMAYQYLRERGEIKVFDQDAARLANIPEAASFEATVTADAVILAVPISALRNVCRLMSPLLRPGQLVIDTCSVKQHPVNWMLETLPDHAQVLGTHPLFGPDSGKNGIAGLKMAICPVRVDEETLEQVRSYLRSLGLNVIETTPEEHDHQIARTQAVFHLIAQAFKRLNWGGEDITTPGPEKFFSLVRTVQNDTDQLFYDLQKENEHAAQSRAEFIEEVSRIHKQLVSLGGSQE